MTDGFSTLLSFSLLSSNLRRGSLRLPLSSARASVSFFPFPAQVTVLWSRRNGITRRRVEKEMLLFLTGGGEGGGGVRRCFVSGGWTEESKVGWLGESKS